MIHICGICEEEFYIMPDFNDYHPIYIELRRGNKIVGKPLCDYCFKNMKRKLRIADDQI